MTGPVVGLTTAPVASPEAVAQPLTPRRGQRRILANGKVTAGVVILGVFTLIAIFGDLIKPYDPSKRSRDILEGPSWRHWSGTTHIGQDIFSQILVGTRSVMFVGLVAGLVATVVAVLVGVTSGYLSGSAAEGLSALSNVFIVIPALPLIIIITNVIPSSGDWTIALVIGCTS